ncbi:interferon alpha-inducible protein 27-like [Silurus asotus]|uniref:Interferon alpha-inducible protein 27-like n=1 Tax=Silurus asotus TaxID=30991 RepID=A0AAD5FCH3_SILAS|nr:interferon alpha-inducible protein 27-like [Silurus asotus]
MGRERTSGEELVKLLFMILIAQVDYVHVIRCSGAQGYNVRPTMITAAVGAGLSVLLTPFVISFAGFTSGGIAAGSIASSMMSSAAIANGGGVASGSLVATLQSLGNHRYTEK